MTAGYYILQESNLTAKTQGVTSRYMYVYMHVCRAYVSSSYAVQSIWCKTL